MTKLSLLSTSALIAIGLASPLAAFGQTSRAAPAEPDGHDRIVVTAQKQEQDLIDVPINISVADQAQLDLLNTDDIEEYADFVPGLQVQAQSLNASSYSLRGVTSDGGRPRVAVFENGVSIGDPRFAANTAMFDLERIEVVKGPQATLFGQGALVGGINFIQNRASLAGNEGWAKLDGGDYGYIRGEAGYNFTLGDTAALRIAGLV
jgi:outer membrane receptor protein involved in Fe transport